MHTWRYYRKRFVLTLISLLLAGVGFYAQKAGLLTDFGATAERSQPGLYKVTYFSDGDTITVDMNGRNEKVRLIGVDTPETHKPNAPVQCYGPAASAFTRNVIGQNVVRLESDPLSTNRDRYDRLLRYVYLPDGTLINERLIREGYGFYYPYFSFSKSQQFSAAQQAAMAAHKGLWGNCKPTPTNGGGYKSNDQGS